MDQQSTTRPRNSDRLDLAVSLGLVSILGILARELILWDPRSGSYEGVLELERFAFDASSGNHQVGLLVAAIMIVLRRQDLRARHRDSSAAILAAAAALGAASLSAWSSHTGATYLVMPALALWLLSAGGAFGGWRGLRAVASAALVLVITTPPPVAVVNLLLHPMQMATAGSVSFLLGLFSIEHVRAAEYVYRDLHIFYVIEGCAGLGILQSLLLASVAMGELLRENVWTRLCLVAASFVVALFVNYLRVLGIVLVPGSAFAEDHALQGIAMVILGVAVLGSLGAALGGALDSAGGDASSERDAAAHSRLPAFAYVLTSAFAFAIAGVVVPRWEVPDTVLPRPAEVAKNLAGFRADRSLELDREYLGSIWWSDRVFRRYVEKAPEGLSAMEIDALVLRDHGRDRRHDIGSSKVVRIEPGLVFRRDVAVELPSSGRAVRLVEAVGPKGVQTILFFRSTPYSGMERFFRAVMAIDQSAWHRPEAEVAVRLAVERELSAPGVQDRLVRFADAFERSLSRRGLLAAPVEGGADWSS
ncbi:MAG: exosortase/archaeosortase family protein [Myxococcota bacterium]